MDVPSTPDHTQVPLPGAKRVPEENRLHFLPTYFGRLLMVRGESLVFDWLGRLCRQYNGAYWHFYEIPNGFYLAPDLSERLQIEAENGFDHEVSPDAAGIIATLYALGQLAGECYGSEQGDRFAQRYYALLAFSDEHPEAALIRCAID